MSFRAALSSLTLLFLLTEAAHADNIIRVMAPVTQSAKQPGESLVLADTDGLRARLNLPFEFDFNSLLGRRNQPEGSPQSVSWSISQLPQGLKFQNGVLSGKPLAKGDYALSVTALGKSSAQNSYTLTVGDTFQKQSCDPQWSSVKYFIGGETQSPYESKAGLSVSDAASVAVDSKGPIDSTKSLRFSGASRLAFADNAALNLGSSDFTIEFFLKMDGYKDVALLGKGGGASIAYYSYFFRAWPNGKISFMASTDNKGYQIGASTAESGFGVYKPGVWTQISVTRQGSVFRAFQDGQLMATYNSSAALFPNNGRGLQIGHNRGNNFTSGPVYTTLAGNIQGVRVSSIARYTESYGPDQISGGACQ